MITVPITPEELKETLDYLTELREEDKEQFYKAYKSLPFDTYSEIERIATSKSAIYKDLCAQAKNIADSFHKSIK